ncbi:MAG: CoA transferase [Gammaproteobacteria bacterium]|jgi:crotonobetainyl-CoA:carnitine CoA-transferase CaiB-like acyl-CoA transferase
MSATQAGPLKGVTVVELAHIMAGPVCGRMLADMGADVIKVERVPGGDTARGFLPPDVDGEPAAFMMLNRNKRGIAVDLKAPAGKEIVQRLLKTADVVIENYRKGTMERLGLGYDELSKNNPGLIYCEISGFGRTGPYADRGGFDLVAQGMSGLMSVTGEGPDRPPIKCGPPVTDITAGLLATMGVLAATIERNKTGKGQRVDTSLFEAGITQTFWQSAIALATGVSPTPMGSAHPLNAPYEAFQTANGWLTLGAASQVVWQRLPDVLGLPELLSDSRFLKNEDRMAHRAELADALAPAFKKRSTNDWLERLDAAGVPAGPVLSVGEMLADPQTKAREMLVETEHQRLGPVPTIGFPVKFSETPAAIERGAPTLGQHTTEVLRELGYADSDIDKLVADSVVIRGD